MLTAPSAHNRDESRGGSALKDRVVTIAVVGLAAVVVALSITWVFWPRESPVVSSGKTVRASEPTAVNDFDVCMPGWQMGHRGSLSFSGQLVVWSLENGSGSRLMAADVRIHEPFLLLRAAKGVSVRQPVLDGETLVWRQRRSSDPAGTTSLWVMDIRTRKARQISTPVTIDGVDVDQGRVAWLQRARTKHGTDDRIYLYDIAGGVREQIPAVRGLKSDVACDQGVVTWAAYEGNGASTGVWIYETLGRHSSRLTAGQARSADISGAYVVWVDMKGAVHTVNLGSGKRRVLAEGNGMARQCRIDGLLAVWWDASALDDTVLLKAGDIYGADLRTDRRFPISTHGTGEESPQVSGLTVVWPDDSRGLWVIRGAQVSL